MVKGIALGLCFFFLGATGLVAPCRADAPEIDSQDVGGDESSQSSSTEFDRDSKQARKLAGEAFVSGQAVSLGFSAELRQREKNRREIRERERKNKHPSREELLGEKEQDQRNDKKIKDFDADLAQAQALQNSIKQETQSLVGLPKREQVQKLREIVPLSCGKWVALAGRFGVPSAKGEAHQQCAALVSQQMKAGGVEGLFSGRRSEESLREDKERADARNKKDQPKATERSIAGVTKTWDPRRPGEAGLGGDDGTGVVALSASALGDSSAPPKSRADFTEYGKTLRTGEVKSAAAESEKDSKFVHLMKDVSRKGDAETMEDLRVLHDPKASLWDKTKALASAARTTTVTATADLLSGEEKATKRAIVGGVAGIGLVGAAAVAAPGAFVAMGLNTAATTGVLWTGGVGAAAAATAATTGATTAGATAISSKAVAAGAGSTILTMHGGVSAATSVGTAALDPTGVNLAFAAADVAGGQVLKVAGKGLKAAKGAYSTAKVADAAAEARQLAQTTLRAESAAVKMGVREGAGAAAGGAAKAAQGVEELAALKQIEAMEAKHGSLDIVIQNAKTAPKVTPGTVDAMKHLEKTSDFLSSPEELAKTAQDPFRFRVFGKAMDNPKLTGEVLGIQRAIDAGDMAKAAALRGQYAKTIGQQTREVLLEQGIDPGRVSFHGTGTDGMAGIIKDNRIRSQIAQSGAGGRGTGIRGEAAHVWAGDLDESSGYAARAATRGKPGVMIVLEDSGAAQAKSGVWTAEPTVSDNVKGFIIIDGEKKAVFIPKEQAMSLHGSYESFTREAEAGLKSGTREGERAYLEWEKFSEQLAPSGATD